jgi:hypothetical protein
MQTFLSYHVYLQAFVAALVLLGLGLEGLSGNNEALPLQVKNSE